MFLTQKNAIRGLSVPEFNTLRDVCRLSNKRFNVRLYIVRSHLLVKLSQATGCLIRKVRTGHNRVRNALNKIARSIIYYCLTHQLGKLLIGCNPAWKQGINLSKQNKFQFVQTHHYVLRFKLKALCQRYGTPYGEKEEGCTSSSASLLDPDELPIYKADNPQGYKFSGRHLCRGLYKSKNCSFIHADCNGATNILKESNHNLDFPGVAKGLFYRSGAR